MSSVPVWVWVCAGLEPPWFTMVALGKFGKELFSRALQPCARVVPRLGNRVWAGLGWLACRSVH